MALAAISFRNFKMSHGKSLNLNPRQKLDRSVEVTENNRIRYEYKRNISLSQFTNFTNSN